MPGCPSPDQLHAFCLQQVTGAEHAAIQQHVLNCDDCRRHYEQIADLENPTVSTASLALSASCLASESPLQNAVAEPSIQRSRLPPELNPPPEELEVTARFRRVGLLGRGGLGEVYAYRDESLRRELAVKLIRPDDDSSECRRRFEREYEITSALEHPGVPPVYSIGQTASGRPFYAMQFVRGETLKKSIQAFHRSAGHALTRQNRDFQQLLHSFQRVCETISHAHARKILHRDLKPENVLLSAEVTTVLDWGIAKRAGDDDALADAERITPDSLTMQGSALGSPAYMSPEQAAGQLEQVDFASDIYGLGAILFEILAGRPPHQLRDDGPPDSQHRLLRQIVEGPTPRARDHNPRVPPELDSICARAMAKSPAARYENPLKIVDDINQWLVDGEVSAHRYSSREKALRMLRRRIRGLLVVAAGFALVTLSALFAYHSVRESRDAEREQRRLAENRLSHMRALQLSYAHRMSQLEIEAGNLEDVEIPPDDMSWDSRHLLHRASRIPFFDKVLADGHCEFTFVLTGPDEKQVVSADSGGRLLVWNAESGRVVREIASGRFSEELGQWLHHYKLRGAATELESWGECFTAGCWLGRSTWFVAASSDGQGVAFDTNTEQRRPLMKSDRALHAVAADPEGQQILFGDAGGRLFQRGEQGEELAESRERTAGVSTIEWVPGCSAWIVGRENGQLELRSRSDLKIVSEATLPAPIWAIAAARTETETTIAVAAESSKIAIYRLSDDRCSLAQSDRIDLAASTATDGSVHAVRFSPDGERLFAVTDTGLMVAINVGLKKVLWTRLAFVNNSAHRGFVEELRQATPPRELALPFRRSCASLISLVREEAILTAGEDEAIRWWRIPNEDSREDHLWKNILGTAPRLVFSAVPSLGIWSLDATGVLRRFEIDQGRVVAEHQAHSGGPGDIALLDAETVVTAGGDHELRFWTYRDGRIIPSPRPPLRHDQPLLSVAVGAEGRWLASVDATSQLIIWRADSGRQIYRTRIEGAYGIRPLTGRAAFNCDGTRLAAFGAGQSCSVFACDPRTDSFRQFPDQIAVAGTQGGTALDWNPAFPSELIVADDFPRYAARSFGEPSRGPPAVDRPTSPCLRIASTPDGRRMVYLEERGRISFVEAAHPVVMLELRSLLTPAADLAFDPTGRWLAVAGRDGSLELWDSHDESRRSNSRPPDSVTAWRTRPLLEAGETKRRFSDTCVDLDDQDRVVFLLHEALPTDQQYDGALYFMRDDGTRLERERIELGDEFDRRMTAEAMGLQLLPRGQAFVAFRRRIGDKGPYNGTAHLARRLGSDRWEYETLHDEGNLLFRPALFLDQSRGIEQILHFSHDGHYLFRTAPSAEGWNYSRVGIRGDGYSLRAARDAERRIHLLFRPMRLNADAHPTVYMRLDQNGQPTVREIVAPHGVYTDFFDLLPDGSPVVKRQDKLLRRTKSGWEVHQTLPDVSVLSGRHIAIDPRGDTWMLDWRSERSQFVLWQGRGDSWTSTGIPYKLPAPALSFTVIRFDRQGNPVLIVGQSVEPHSWLTVLRKP